MFYSKSKTIRHTEEFNQIIEDNKLLGDLCVSAISKWNGKEESKTKVSPSNLRHKRCHYDPIICLFLRLKACTLVWLNKKNTFLHFVYPNSRKVAHWAKLKHTSHCFFLFSIKTGIKLSLKNTFWLLLDTSNCFICVFINC